MNGNRYLPFSISSSLISMPYAAFLSRARVDACFIKDSKVSTSCLSLSFLWTEKGTSKVSVTS